MEDLRRTIREILSEELARLRSDPEAAPITAPRVSEESVVIRSSADLNDFARRVLAMAQDGRRRADILDGRHRFTLAQGAAAPVQAHLPAAPAPQATPVAQFTRGLISERDIAALPGGTRRLRAGKAVRFTPLARDELRRRGITVERTSS